MAYPISLDELHFAIRTHGCLDEVLALPFAATVDEEIIDAILTEAAKFASADWAESNIKGDKNGAKLHDGKVFSDTSFQAAYRNFCEAGWAGLRLPEEYGGQGLPMILAASCEEMWYGGNLSLSLLPMLTGGAIAALQEHASEEIKQQFLPKMCEGVWSGTMNLTEPQAGTDLAQVSTKAIAKGDAYAITGQKIFITWGDHELTENIIHLVLARLPGAPAGVKGISLFVVPKFLLNTDGSLGERNPVHAVSLEHKLGIHGSPTCVMQFEEAEGYLVGEAGRGLVYMFTMMNHARLGVGIEGHAVADRAYKHALNYARERVQSRDIGGKSAIPVHIIHHPDVRRMLLTQKATLEAQRALYLLCAAMMDKAHGHPNPEAAQQAQAIVNFMIPIIKGFCTENGNTLTNMALQVFGGMGYIEETGAAQFVRDVRIAAIYEGTNGIQALDLIGRKTAADKGAVAKAMLDEYAHLAQQLRSAQPKMAEKLQQAIDLSLQSIDYILAQYIDNPEYAAAGSLPYLMQMGYTLGAGEMAKAHLAAQKALADVDNAALSASFYHQKQATVAIYYDWVLPHIHTCSAQVLYGAKSLLSIEVNDIE